MDNNPALPNMGRIINKHKHILELDNELMDLIPIGGLFVASRKCRTIGDMLIHNKYRSDGEQIHEDIINNAIVGEGECFACGKCYACRSEYLLKCSTFTSYHTSQIFPINDYITCQTKYVIYLMQCITCLRGYVGYYTTNLPKRLTVNKCHIKSGRRSCRLVNHFLDIDHDLDFSTKESFNNSLSKHLKNNTSGNS